MKHVIKGEIFRVVIVVLSAVIYSLGLMWFLEPAGLYSGGIVGLSQLIVNIISKYTSLNIPIGVLIFTINIPIVIIGWKLVSLRFALYSVLSILIQTVVTLGFIPVPEFGINDDLLLLAILGGFSVGVGCAIALRYGTSTGGIDIIGQALAFKKNISIGYITMLFNIAIAIAAGFLFGWQIAFYTIVRIVITMIVTDRIHTAYNYLKVEIVTSHGDEISSEIMTKIERGITIIRGEGAYTHSTKAILETVVSSYELHEVIAISKSVDENVFITVSPIKVVVGNFKRKTIA